MTDPLVLKLGLDTLEVTFDGEVRESLLAELEALKVLAQDTETPRPFWLGGLEFMVQAKGASAWSYHLRNRDWAIFISRSKNEFYPKAKVSLGAYGLSTRMLTELWSEVLATLRSLGTLTEHGVSRADVQVDFQGWTPTLKEMSKNVSCRARKNPIYPNLSAPETYYFGLGGLRVLRVYNKTVETSHFAKKGWLLAIYEEVSGFDAAQDVWRIEFQIRRDALHELGLRTSSQVFASVGALLDYGMREFAQLRSPTNDSKITRWPEDPRWTALRTACEPSANLVRARHASNFMPLDDVVKRHLGLVAAAGAYLGDTDYMKTLQHLSLLAEAHMMTEKVEFRLMVETRRRRLCLTRGESLEASEPF